MLPVKATRDPAPSRLKYRLERLWLRPAIRISVRIGLPLAALALIGVAAATDPGVRQAVADRAQAGRDAIAAHPALRVDRIAVNAVSAELSAALAPVLDIPLPVSSMDLDLDDLYDRIAALEAVAAASVRIESGGTLKIQVEERTPAVLWRHDDGSMELLDASGRRVGGATGRADWPELPLIAGQGADRVTGEALALLRLALPLSDKVRGLVRVGERRWNLELTTDVVVMLPETGAQAALARALALNDADDLFARDISHVDMRDGRRPILRLKTPAVDMMRNLRNPEGERDA
ncbi:cell division protein FtsQ [Rhodobacteraceae bacterium 2CG4]|uniref:Cell division protein FtsQ n=1 Tax=Halovulum marinum TaxID=2662447 RepID=A0A6L5Z3K6_9RHOB|nr:cell division protein FtsQ/DivIB [Halovulum marinum]MSU90564.1 cell division protein FtsQ [Halovulum marinum]